VKDQRQNKEQDHRVWDRGENQDQAIQEQAWDQDGIFQSWN